jgi:hypothetical protein
VTDLATGTVNTGQVIDGSCAFCKAGGSRVPARETFTHIFSSVPLLGTKLTIFVSHIYEGSIDLIPIRTKFFTGIDSNGFINLSGAKYIVSF